MNDAHILLVEDDEAILRVFGEILRGEGFNVETSQSGKDAILKVKEAKFDLALLDIVMPDLRGDEIAKEIKELEPETRIIFITGYPSFQQCIDALDLGVFEIMLKPIEPEELLNVVREAVNNLEEPYNVEVTSK